MIDRYTKIVLTVIAVSLAALALQGFTPEAVAAGLEGCGQSQSRPCHVSVANKVTVGNEWPNALEVELRSFHPLEVRVVGK